MSTALCTVPSLTNYAVRSFDHRSVTSGRAVIIAIIVRLVAYCWLWWNGFIFFPGGVVVKVSTPRLVCLGGLSDHTFSDLDRCC